MKFFKDTPTPNTMETTAFTPQQIFLDPMDNPYFPKEERLEELLDKITRILTIHGIEYEYNDLYNEFRLRLQNTTTSHSLRIYTNAGPYAKLDIDRRFAIVTKVYGNERYLSDYQLMRVLGHIIQDGDGDYKSEELESILGNFVGSTDIDALENEQ